MSVIRVRSLLRWTDNATLGQSEAQLYILFEKLLKVKTTAIMKNYFLH
jgi:hypothetical protein